MGCSGSKEAVPVSDGPEPSNAPPPPPVTTQSAASSGGDSFSEDGSKGSSGFKLDGSQKRKKSLNLASPVVKGVEKGAQVVRHSAKTVGKGVTTVGTTVGKGVTTVGTTVGKGVTTAGHQTIKGVQKVGDVTVKGVQKVGDTAIKGVHKVGDVTMTVGTHAVKGAQTVGGHAVKGVQTVGHTAVKGVQTVGTTTVKGVKTVGKGAKRGMDETLRRLSMVGNKFLDPSIALQLLRPIGDHMKEGAHHVKNIFAKPLNFKESYRPPNHPKTDDERACIEMALKGNFVFQTLTDYTQLINAFEKVQFKENDLIIKQGDDGDYFYTIWDGECEFLVDEKEVGSAGPGVSFGELALLYTCPRAASVKALEDVILFRVDQTCFRYLLKNIQEQSQTEKLELLAGINFLKGLAPAERSKLSRVMEPIRYRTGDYLVTKGDPGNAFYIVKVGKMKATDIGYGTAETEDKELNPGDYFGEKALVSGEPHSANVIAQEDGLGFKIAKDTFEKVLGKLSKLILRAQEQKALSEIALIQDSDLDALTLQSLAKLIKEKKFKAGERLFIEKQPVNAAMYFVREGKVEIHGGEEMMIKEPGDHFGEEQLLADSSTNKGSKSKHAKFTPKTTATAIVDCTLGLLTLDNCRKVLDTQYLGKPPPSVKDSLIDREVTDKDLKRHKLLGAGTFGQVWLVSRISHGDKLPYALKIQSKYELIQDGQAKAVVLEKKIMAQLRHPFLIGLINSYQDEHFVYMLMDIVQGGELYNVIHTDERDWLPEDHTQFYAAGIAEGLGFMHQRGYVYRDLKPENVLINAYGYPVIIDFGFAKYVTDKTFTLCGTPLYLAPEVILNRGHNWGADHWSMGVLIYEMLKGRTPFYKEGMQQMDLFRAIVKGVFDLRPDCCSSECANMINGLLTRNPLQRLGSLAGSEDDILHHDWFAKIDFDKLRAFDMEAPYKPEIKNPLDSSHYEDWSHLEDKTKKKFPKLKKEQADIFLDF